MRPQHLLFVFVIIAGWVNYSFAGKLTYKGVAVEPDRASLVRVGMFAPKDSPSPSHKDSFINVKVKFTRTEQTTQGKVHVLIFHSENKKYLGTLDSDRKLVYCCNADLHTNGDCPVLGDVIVEKANLSNFWNTSPAFQVNQSEIIYESHHSIAKSGIYYAYFVNCKSSNTGTFKINGKVTFYNPYGYLNGDLYFFMPFYGALSLVYIFVGLVWLFLSYRHRAQVLKLQKWIGGVILLGVLETATLYFDDLGYNNIGENYVGAMIVGVIVSTLKRTISRILVLVVCMGYGVVKPTLGTTSYRVALLGFFYFIFSGAINIVDLVQRTTYISPTVLVFLVIPVAFLDTWFYWWIVVSLLRTITQLQQRKQTIKLAMYKKFLITLVSAGAICVIVVFSETIVTVSTAEDSTWKTGWMWSAFWHLLYLAILLTIAIIWRPTTNNTRYAYSEMGGDDEDGDTSLQLQGMAVPIQRKPQEPSGREETREEVSKKDLSPSFTIDDDEDSKLH